MSLSDSRCQQALAKGESMSLKQGGYGLPCMLLVPAGRIRYPPAYGLPFPVTSLVRQREK
jgi:hypothetical protein